MKYFNAPVPEAWRERVEAFVRKIRPNDAEEAIRSLKVSEVSQYIYKFIIFRIEADCREDVCMTVFALPSGPELKVGFVINAGPWLYAADAPGGLWGASWYSHVFPSANGSYLIVHSRGEQFAFSACNDCYGFTNKSFNKSSLKIREEELNSKTINRTMETFEEFRRQIDR